MKHFKSFLSVFFLGLLIFSLASMVACKKDDEHDEDGEHHDGEYHDDYGGPGGPSGCVGCDGGGGSLMFGLKAQADLNNAFGLLVVDPDEEASLNLVKRHNEKVEKLKLKGAPTFKQSNNQFSLVKSDETHVAHYLEDGTAFAFPSIAKRGFGVVDVEEDPRMQKINEETGEVEDALTQYVTDSNAYDPNMKLPKLSTIAVSPTKDIYLHFEDSFIYKDAPHSEDPWNPSNGYRCQLSLCLEELLMNFS